MLRVFVVSPLPAVRAGLKALLAADSGVAVVGEAGSLDAARRGPFESVGTRADVLVVDAPRGFPDDDLAQLGELAPTAGVVVLGPVPGEERLVAALADRPWSYLPRETSAEQLAAAVHAAAAGLVSLDTVLGRNLMARLRTAIENEPDTPEAAAGQDLTPREREVLDLVAVGMANKMIARRLSISEHTVKFHIAAILAKLGAGSRTEAVHLAARRGLVAL
jgi:DNA-binding NarL/FixJ family response regulator